MSVTTIKVDSALRDRLAALGRKRELTLGELINELVRQAEDEEYWREINAAYARLQEKPEDWADYLAEGRMWTEGANDAIWGDAAAARNEFPEFNK